MSAAVQEKKAAKAKAKAEAKQQKKALLRLLTPLFPLLLLCLGSETRDKGGAEPEANKDKVGTRLLQHCPTLIVLYLPPLLSSLSSSLRNLHNMALLDRDSCVQRAACRSCSPKAATKISALTRAAHANRRGRRRL
jgi:hypothetical protein